ncbi:conserved hypothetical protein [Neospora caninum Liverpool]|uniref:Uncharacterized protein n=1 Tax=Neospora caninum (strain Liverpool) TaxID=572307 RepID=F0VNI4_NEOCL|nr:conserved hypothetical protein [Neospora caninum Liverpool]CBZ55280.1 conserved hypothetical protein [Neospora caninum Liverpool]CEL70011.1 TPA: hypothetical protein BN1204_057030 [Neospora caninum Liverpool]|eukprot:XP_003885308.1 conserved hypothetical protein [Neospora caninum Liverpool]
MNLDEAYCPPPSRHHRRHRERKLDAELCEDQESGGASSPQSGASPVDATGETLSLSSTFDGYRGFSTPSIMLTQSGHLHNIAGGASSFLSVAGNPGYFAQPQNATFTPQPNTGCATMAVQSSPSPVFLPGDCQSAVFVQQASPTQQFVVRPGQPQVALQPTLHQGCVQATGLQQGVQPAGLTQPPMSLQSGMRLIPANIPQTAVQSPCQTPFVFQPQLHQAPVQVHSPPVTLAPGTPQITAAAPVCSSCLRPAEPAVSLPHGSCHRPSASEPQMLILQSPAVSYPPGASALYGGSGAAATVPLAQTGAMPTAFPQLQPQVLWPALRQGQPVSCCYPVGGSATAAMTVVGSPKVAIQGGSPGMMVSSGGHVNLQLPQGVVLAVPGMGSTPVAEAASGQPVLVLGGGSVLRDASGLGYPTALSAVPPSIAALQAGHVFSRSGKKGSAGEGEDGRKDRQQTGTLWCGPSGR